MCFKYLFHRYLLVLSHFRPPNSVVGENSDFGIFVHDERSKVQSHLFTASCKSLSLFLRLEPFFYIANDERGTQIRTGTLIGTTTLPNGKDGKEIKNKNFVLFYIALT